MEKTFKEIKWKKQFKLWEHVFKSLKDNTKPLLTSVLCEGGCCIGCGRTIQHHVSCQYCNPFEIVSLEMVHKDYIWINVRQGHYVSCMVHFDRFNDSIVLYKIIYLKKSLHIQVIDL